MHMHDSVHEVLHCKLNLAFSAICKVTTSKFTANLLLLSHLENNIKFTFVATNHKLFLVRQFCAPLPAAPGGNCPPLPPQLRHCIRHDKLLSNLSPKIQRTIHNNVINISYK